MNTQKFWGTRRKNRRAQGAGRAHLRSYKWRSRRPYPEIPSLGVSFTLCDGRAWEGATDPETGSGVWDQAEDKAESRKPGGLSWGAEQNTRGKRAFLSPSTDPCGQAFVE